MKGEFEMQLGVLANTNSIQLSGLNSTHINLPEQGKSLLKNYMLQINAIHSYWRLRRSHQRNQSKLISVR